MSNLDDMIDENIAFLSWLNFLIWTFWLNFLTFDFYNLYEYQKIKPSEILKNVPEYQNSITLKYQNAYQIIETVA